YIYNFDNIFYFFNGYDNDFYSFYIFYQENEDSEQSHNFNWKFEVEELLPLKRFNMSISTKFQMLLPSLSKEHQDREEEINKVMSFLESSEAGCLLIEGNWGLGKTTFLSKLISELQIQNKDSNKPKYIIIEYFLAEYDNTNKSEFFQEYFVARVNDYIDLEESTIFENSFFNIINILKSSENSIGKIVIFIDNLDKIQTQIFNYLLKAAEMGIKIIYTAKPDYLDYNNNLNNIKIHTKQKLILKPLSDSMIHSFWNDIYSIKMEKKEILDNLMYKTNKNPLLVKLWFQSIKSERNDIHLIARDVKNDFDKKLLDIKKERNNSNDFFSILDILCYTNSTLSIDEICILLNKKDKEIIELLYFVSDLLLYKDKKWQIGTVAFKEYYTNKYKVPVNLVRSKFIIPCIERGESIPEGLKISESFIYEYKEKMNKELNYKKIELTRIRAKYGV
ncbi:MAG: ATP-binding protein, partial [Nanoarchaeota archaeon]|nr:ATP-binding protein [Nanoarchaeota archaeon]